MKEYMLVTFKVAAQAYRNYTPYIVYVLHREFILRPIVSKGSHVIGQVSHPHRYVKYVQQIVPYRS